MNFRNVTRILASFILIALIAIIIWLVLLLMYLPSVSSQLPPGNGSLKVNLFLPENNVSLPSGSQVSVQAEALGVNAITTIQFWVDGVAADASAAGEGISTKTLNANWSWLPASDGVHILVARAEDGQGNVGVSNPVRVMVTTMESSRGAIT